MTPEVLIFLLRGHLAKLNLSCVLIWKCHFSGSENDLAEVELRKPSVSYFWSPGHSWGDLTPCPHPTKLTAITKTKLQEPSMTLLAPLDGRVKSEKQMGSVLEFCSLLAQARKPSVWSQLPLFFSSNSRMRPLMWDNFWCRYSQRCFSSR